MVGSPNREMCITKHMQPLAFPQTACRSRPPLGACCAQVSRLTAALDAAEADKEELIEMQWQLHEALEEAAAEKARLEGLLGRQERELAAAVEDKARLEGELVQLREGQGASWRELQSQVRWRRLWRVVWRARRCVM